MRRQLCTLAVVPILVAATALSLAAGVMQAPLAQAAPAQAAMATNGNTTSSGTETLHVSAALCAKLKASFPQYAQDPRLCTFTHQWTQTPSAAATVAKASATANGPAIAASCPVGNVSFHDWNKSTLFQWEMDLDTTFNWWGGCGAPDLTRQSCWVAYTINATVTQERCYDYFTSVPSHAAVYSGLVTDYTGPFTTQFPTSQRRECYSSYNNCNWTYWDGW